MHASPNSDFTFQPDETLRKTSEELRQLTRQVFKSIVVVGSDDNRRTHDGTVWFAIFLVVIFFEMVPIFFVVIF